MTVLYKVYNSGRVFGRSQVEGWRGVRTGIGNFWDAGQWVRRAVNFQSKDRSVRRRHGMIRVTRVDDTVLHVRLFPEARAAAIGTSLYVNTQDERQKSGSDSVVF